MMAETHRIPPLTDRSAYAFYAGLLIVLGAAGSFLLQNWFKNPEKKN